MMLNFPMIPLLFSAISLWSVLFVNADTTGSSDHNPDPRWPIKDQSLCDTIQAGIDFINRISSAEISAELGLMSVSADSTGLEITMAMGYPSHSSSQSGTNSEHSDTPTLLAGHLALGFYVIVARIPAPAPVLLGQGLSLAIPSEKVDRPRSPQRSQQGQRTWNMASHRSSASWDLVSVNNYEPHTHGIMVSRLERWEPFHLKDFRAHSMDFLRAWAIGRNQLLQAGEANAISRKMRIAKPIRCRWPHLQGQFLTMFSLEHRSAISLADHGVSGLLVVGDSGRTRDVIVTARPIDASVDPYTFRPSNS